MPDRHAGPRPRLDADVLTFSLVLGAPLLLRYLKVRTPPEAFAIIAVVDEPGFSPKAPPSVDRILSRWSRVAIGKGWLRVIGPAAGRRSAIDQTR